MRPSISSTKFLEIASPKPVPPNRRVVEASTCMNDWNNRSSAGPAMPIPVSRTVKCTSRKSSGPVFVTRADTTISPLAVNLIALPSKFKNTCRSRVKSPTTHAGTSSASSHARFKPFSAAFGASKSSARSTHCRNCSGSRSNSIFPHSIFEKSRMLSICASNASPPSRIVSTNSRCSLVTGDSSNKSVIEITPFIGVRNS